MNKAVLMGRLVRDPEVRTTQSGTSVANFTLAIDRQYKNSDGSRTTDFIPCVAWRQTGEFVYKYFRKGDRLLAEGTIQPSSWIDNDGQKRYKTEVVVDQVHFCESKSSSQQSRESYQADEYLDEAEDTPLPFDMS